MKPKVNLPLYAFALCKQNHFSNPSAFRKFNKTLRMTLEIFFGCPLNNFQWQLACMPDRHGCLNLRPAAKTDEAAYIVYGIDRAPPCEALL